MPKELCISDAFEIYRLEVIVYLNQSSRTEEMSLGAMKSLVKFTGDIPMTDLTFDKIRKWKEHLGKNLEQSTVRGYILKLRVVLKHLNRKGYKGIINHEMVGVPKRIDKIVDFLTPAEVSHFINVAFKPTAGYQEINRYKNRAIVSFLYASGIRVTELCKLNIISLREDNTFSIIGKGGRAKLCFFDDRARKHIEAYLELRTDNDPALFISEKTGGRVSKGTVELIFRNLTKKAGYTRAITPHTMRHSYATNLLRNNTNLLYVRDFLGHKSIQTTEMYTHVVNEDLRQIYVLKHST